MLIPSIDLMNGHAVQLIGGQQLELDAGDPRPIAERFALVGEIAVVDLDAALGRGSNAAVIHDLLRIAPCRVGGGIRTVAQAREWLNAGATRVVLGTAATPEILSQLPRERVIAALDAVNDEVVVRGWRQRTGRNVAARMHELAGHVGGFLVTFVEREGRLGGTRLDAAAELLKLAGNARVTFAGGITTADEIATLDRLGADAQVGMALYKGVLPLADAFAAPLSTDRPDGLFPTVVVDEFGVALGLAYSTRDTLREALERRRGVYHSRRRGRWEKGADSGATQELLRIALDCDRDTLRFTVRQHGAGFCHRNTWTCWGSDHGLAALWRRIEQRVAQSASAATDAKSYTRRLLSDPALLHSKLLEEAAELASAAQSGTRPDAVWETADLLYFALVALAGRGGTLAEVGAELDRRDQLLERKPGHAKETLGAGHPANAERDQCNP